MSDCSDPPSAFCDNPGSLPPSGPAGGDLTGTYPNPLLVSILAGGTFGDATHVAQVTVDNKGRITAVAVVSIAGTTPGGPAGGDLAGSYPDPVLAAIFAGGTFADATHVAQITVDTKGRITAVSSVLISGTAPGGPAGGDLAGTYPAPSLAAIFAGGTFGDATHIAQVTVDTKGRITAVSSVLISGTAPGGPAGGDLAGSYPNPALAAIIAGGTFGDATHVAAVTVDTKGRITAVSSVLITGTTPGGSAGGDLAGSYPNPTLAAIIAGGTFGSGTQVAQITVDTKGRITAVSNVGISPAALLPLTTSLAAGAPPIDGTTTRTAAGLIGRWVYASFNLTPAVAQPAGVGLEVETGVATGAYTRVLNVQAPLGAANLDKRTMSFFVPTGRRYRYVNTSGAGATATFDVYDTIDM